MTTPKAIDVWIFLDLDEADAAAIYTSHSKALERLEAAPIHHRTNIFRRYLEIPAPKKTR